MTEQQPKIDEHEFWEWINAMGKLFQKYHSAEDLHGMTTILRKLNTAYEDASEDPYLSTLETTSAKAICLLAKYHVGRIEFEKAIKLCERTKTLLEAKAERYQLNNKPPRPDSISWSFLLQVLSEIKWMGPESYKDEVMTPLEIIDRYRSVLVTCHEKMQQVPWEDKKDNDAYIEILANAGASVVKLATRFHEDEKEPLFKLCDELNRGWLSDETRPIFWDLKIAELFLTGRLNKENARRCVNKIQELYENLREPGSDLTGFRRSLESEIAYLLSLTQPQFTVLDV